MAKSTNRLAYIRERIETTANIRLNEIASQCETKMRNLDAEVLAMLPKLKFTGKELLALDANLKSDKWYGDRHGLPIARLGILHPELAGLIADIQKNNTGEENKKKIRQAAVRAELTKVLDSVIINGADFEAENNRFERAIFRI